MISEPVRQPAQPVPSAAAFNGVDRARQLYSALAGRPGLTLPGTAFAAVKGTANDLLGRPLAAMWINTLPDSTAGSLLDVACVRLDAVTSMPQDAGLDAYTLALALQQASLRPDLPPPPLAALLLAALPAPCVAFTQPVAVAAAGLSVDPEAAVAELFGGKMLYLAGSSDVLDLAARAEALIRANPSASGLVIGCSGLLTWAADVDSIVNHTLTLFEQSSACLPPVAGTGEEHPSVTLAMLLPVLRGLLGYAGRGVVQLDTSAAAMAAVNAGQDSNSAVRQHLVDAGILPVWIHLPAGLEATAESVTAAIAPGAMAELQVNTAGDPKTVAVLLPGIGIAACAGSPAAAAAALQLCRHWLQAVQAAGTLGGCAASAVASGGPAWSYSASTMQRPRRELEGKIALITGAASGIGRAMAIRFAQEGACVAACDINDAGLQEVVAEIEANAGSQRAIALHCDVSDAESVAAAYQNVVLVYGGLDIAVANAGLAMSAGVDEMPVERWRKILDVNLTGYFLTAGEAFRLFKTQGAGGALIFIASKAGLAAGPGSAAYGSTKAAEMHLGRILAEEGGPAGIRVNTVCPDAVFRGSAIWQLGWKEERARFYGIKPEEVEEHYRQRCALKVSIYAEDVAEAVVFLASDRAAKTTGAILTVDGGMAGAYVR